MKPYILCLFFLVSLGTVQAQDTEPKPKTKKEIRREKINEIIRQEEEGVIRYRKHFAMGIKLNTNGYGAFLEMGRAQTVKKSLLFQFEFAERKHPKEYKQQNQDIFSIASPLIYGKLNFFYPVKLGVQKQFLLGNKSNKNGVSITGNIGGGIALGLLRPYMVEVDKNGERTFVSYNPADSAFFLDYSYIYGGPNFGTGWGDLKLTPGLYVKPAFRFDYGRYNELISGIEVGLTAEFYSKKIPQMVFYKQEQFFFSAYFALIFGRRK